MQQNLNLEILETSDAAILFLTKLQHYQTEKVLIYNLGLIFLTKIRFFEFIWSLLS